MISNLKMFSLLLILGLSITSCGGGVDCDDEQAVANAFTEGFSDVLTASLSFDGDPTGDNCKVLVSALEGWINSLEDFEECAEEFGQGQDFRDSINEARSDLGDLSCG